MTFLAVHALPWVQNRIFVLPPHFLYFLFFIPLFVGGMHSIGMASADLYEISIVITFLLHKGTKRHDL